MPDGVFAETVRFAERSGAAVLHDFAYGDLVFDGRRPASFLAEPGAKEVGIELFAMSKSYGMAGWRLGFAVGNAELVGRLELIQAHLRAGIFAPLQEAAIAALLGPQESVEERRALYEARRDRVVAALPGTRVGGDVLRLVARCRTASARSGSSRRHASRSRPARVSAHAAPATHASRWQFRTRCSTRGWRACEACSARRRGLRCELGMGRTPHAAAVVVPALLVLPSASAKNFGPGDLRVCNAERCVAIVKREVLPQIGAFYYSGPALKRLRSTGTGDAVLRAAVPQQRTSPGSSPPGRSTASQLRRPPGAVRRNRGRRPAAVRDGAPPADDRSAPAPPHPRGARESH